MNKNLVALIGGIGFVITAAGISYVGYNVLKDQRGYLEKKEKIILGISGAGLVTLGYCLNELNKKEKRKK
jgi:ABC-type polar amino acid transport system ATPase subunit